jgi:hypothetical protein
MAIAQASSREHRRWGRRWTPELTAGNEVKMRSATIVSAIAVGLVTLARADDSTRVRPDSASYRTGTVDYVSEPGAYGKWDDRISWAWRGGEAIYRACGWCRFNLSAIPDTARITDATLWYYVSYTVGGVATFVRHLTSDPVPESAEALMYEASTGQVIGSTGLNRLGWNSIALDSSGWSAIQQGLTKDWVAVAWDNVNSFTSTTSVSGWQSADCPIMVVGFRLGGISELTESRPVGWELSVAPNPARAATRVSCSIPSAGGRVPAPGRFSLTLYDCSGRFVRTLAGGRCAEGPCRVALTAAPDPGLYLLVFEAGSHRITRKLVVE